MVSNGRWSAWGLALLVVSLAPPQAVWARSIVIGSIGREPMAEVEKFLPLARYLAKELQAEGIDHGEVIVAGTMPQMATFLREGKVDLYLDSPFPSLAVSRLSGSKFLLRRWKKGLSEYRSLIFVRSENGDRRLEDLKGKIIAFEKPHSSTGYFLPKMAFAKAGLKLVLKQDATDLGGPDEVGYVFAGSDENIIAWVLRGKVSAGAMDPQTYQRYTTGRVNRLAVIYESAALPRHIVSYRANLPPPLVARIKHILISMEQSEAGRKALREFEETTRFDELSDHALAPLLRMRPWIDAELGVR